MNPVPYPPPPRGPLREISERLEKGALGAQAADDLLAAGFDFQSVALHVHDVDWWKKQPVKESGSAKHRWKINDWDATLRLEASDVIIWVDPGPDAPFPDPAPELVLITHAHADHTDKLLDWIEKYPDMNVAMTCLTMQLLELRHAHTEIVQRLRERTTLLDFHQTRTILGVTLCFLPAGHLLGAAMLEIEVDSDRILITGDFSLREVGGLPGAVLPEKEYSLVIIEAKEASKNKAPFADLKQTRMPFLHDVSEKYWATQKSLLINAQSFAQAQEAYAALVMSQRAGAFSNSSILLSGMAASVSNLYEQCLKSQSDVWKLPFLRLPEKNQEINITITSAQGHQSLEEDTIIERPVLFTHAGWAEKILFATQTACHQIVYYHGFSTSLDIALNELGRKRKSLNEEI